MERNKIIRNTIAITKFLKWILIVLFAVFSITLIHSAISPETYTNFQIKPDQTTLSFNLRFCPTCERLPENVYLSEMGIGIKFWTLLHISAFAYILLLILNRIIKIWESVEDYNTFYNNNIEHFKHIAKYCTWIFALGLFNFVDEGIYGIGLELGFPIVWLFYGLISLTLGEIFKEGKLLQEDKNAIV